VDKSPPILTGSQNVHMAGHSYQKVICMANSFGWIFQAKLTCNMILNNCIRDEVFLPR